jgi:hypothetical protein
METSRFLGAAWIRYSMEGPRVAVTGRQHEVIDLDLR